MARNGKADVMNLQKRILVLLTDIAILTELSVSIYLANGDQENFTFLFLKYFLSMVVPTLIVALIAIKKTRSKESPVAESHLSCAQPRTTTVCGEPPL
jgi:hypothetical protein